jgi:hypothetical protein
LFGLLSQLSELEESDSGVVQLAFIMAPTICRPLNHAYMSIRHMEQLKKIRPVILFLIENYADVFFPFVPAATTIGVAGATALASPLVTTTTTTGGLPSSPSAVSIVGSPVRPIASGGADGPIGLMGLSLDCKPLGGEETGSGGSGGGGCGAFIKPNLLVVIPVLQTGAAAAAAASCESGSEGESESDKSSNNVLSYSDTEWKVRNY